MRRNKRLSRVGIQLWSSSDMLVKVDAEGNVVVDYIYDDATEQNKFGYCAVKKDGVWKPGLPKG